MKTQVIWVSNVDDFLSIDEKISWVKVPRLLLAFRSDIKIPVDKFDLVRIERQVKKLGARLAIVSTQTNVKLLCNELSIPIFNSVQIAQTSPWKGNNDPAPGITHLKRNARSILDMQQKKELPKSIPVIIRLIAFFAGILAVLSIVVLFVPSATISLELESRYFEMTVPMVAYLDSGRITNPSSIQAEAISTVVEMTKTSLAKGTILVPNTYATGQVRFTNMTDGSIYIPDHTIIGTLDSIPIRFMTTEEGTIPAGVGERIDISIIAELPGLSGNIPVGGIATVEGSLGAKVSVVNLEPTIGGTEKESPSPTEEDKQEIYLELSRAVLSQCLRSLGDFQPSDTILFPESIIYSIVNTEYFPSDGQPGETISLTMSIKCTGMIVEKGELTDAALLILETNLQDGFIMMGRDITLTHDPASYSDGVVSWEMTTSGYVLSIINTPSIIHQITGKNPEEAISYLESELLLGSRPLLHIDPVWWPRLPLLPFRISIQPVE